MGCCKSKYIFLIVGFSAFIILGFLGYDKFIQQPKESKAMNDMYTAQTYFDEAISSVNQDSLLIYHSMVMVLNMAC